MISSYVSSANLQKDLRASIVVFLIALPLAMGVAIASGFPPIAGLITGVVGGMVVGLVSGAPLQVSGAAAGLTVIVYQGVEEFGLDNVGIAILLAGILQVVAAALGLGRWFRHISPAVLYGMLAGIGVLIVASQLHVMMDLSPQGSGLENLAAIPDSLIRALSIDFIEPSSVTFAFAIGMLSIGMMFAWPKIGRGIIQIIPAPLAAVLICSLIAALTSLPVEYITIPKDLLGKWHFHLPNFSPMIDTPMLLVFAGQLALIASAESLLCAAAVDQMHKSHQTKYNQELAAQGLGNAICGFLGALPMTGVIVRSSANVTSGAVSRLSTMLHGLWILLFVSVFPDVLHLIPISALAGILVFTGVKLVDRAKIREFYAKDRSDLAIYLSTVVIIVCYDLLLGVVAGCLLSGLRMLMRPARKQTEIPQVQLGPHSENLAQHSSS